MLELLRFHPFLVHGNFQSLGHFVIFLVDSYRLHLRHLQYLPANVSQVYNAILDRD